MRLRAHIAGHLIALLLMAFWAAQPVLGLVHARTHAHRYCPTHFTFEEASSNGGPSLSARPHSTQEIEKRTSDSPGTVGHEQCSCDPTSRRPELPGPERQLLVRHSLDVSRPATAPTRPSPPLSVLDTAPKASPPAHV